jgi:hypothetical protein
LARLVRTSGWSGLIVSLVEARQRFLKAAEPSLKDRQQITRAEVIGLGTKDFLTKGFRLIKMPRLI